eukprot:3241891-Prymnesium_polylepis.1
MAALTQCLAMQKFGCRPVPRFRDRLAVEKASCTRECIGGTRKQAPAGSKRQTTEKHHGAHGPDHHERTSHCEQRSVLLAIAAQR